jgi:polyphosphate kinase 2 (PPK2 family)
VSIVLVHENTILVKLWMHIGKKLQKKRLQPLPSWPITERDWRSFKRYDEFREISEHAFRRASTSEAPWHIVEAADERHRALSVVKIIYGGRGHRRLRGGDAAAGGGAARGRS